VRRSASDRELGDHRFRTTAAIGIQFELLADVAATAAAAARPPPRPAPPPRSATNSTAAATAGACMAIWFRLSRLPTQSMSQAITAADPGHSPGMSSAAATNN
jgi:hypothetical protein